MQHTEVMGREAELYVKLSNGRIKCTACARLCEIPEGKTGLCGVRGVTNNSLYLYVYGRVITGHIDPIEKKPVTHYKPGTAIYSIATTGCNWLCKYCQNYDISQRRKIEGVEMTPKEVIQSAYEYTPMVLHIPITNLLFLLNLQKTVESRPIKEAFLISLFQMAMIHLILLL